MPSSDLMHRFLFEEADLRGEMVTLEDSYQTILANNAGLPAAVRALLGEFAAAVSLLSATLKFDGILTLQARGDGPLPLIMAECDHQKRLRAIARPRPEVNFDEVDGKSLRSLLGRAVLAIIVDPDQGERYQGIVPLDGSSLSDCLQDYFNQSEQLPSRFWLASDSHRASGLMLQALPQQVASTDDNRDLWQTAVQLADTIKREELLQLEHGEVLYRLFHEHKLRLFEPAALRFECSCSRERSANALVSLGREEVEGLLQERDMINIDCQFCNRNYVFGPQDLDGIFGNQQTPLH